MSGPRWLEAIDSLEFVPAGHGGRCVVHRLAFRVLLASEPGPQACLAFFSARRRAFDDAAEAKIAARGLQPGAAFHLNSRDIRAALAAEAGEEPAAGAAHHEPE